MTTFTNIQRNCNNGRFNGGRKLHMLDKPGACETISGGSSFVGSRRYRFPHPLPILIARSLGLCSSLRKCAKIRRFPGQEEPEAAARLGLFFCRLLLSAQEHCSGATTGIATDAIMQKRVVSGSAQTGKPAWFAYGKAVLAPVLFLPKVSVKFP